MLEENEGWSRKSHAEERRKTKKCTQHNALAECRDFQAGALTFPKNRSAPSCSSSTLFRTSQPCILTLDIALSFSPCLLHQLVRLGHSEHVEVEANADASNLTDQEQLRLDLR